MDPFRVCYMVAVGVPPSSVESFREAFPYELRPAPPYVNAAFDVSAAAFLVNLGVCACDRFIDPIGPEEAERIRTKYRRRRWSDRRIERVLAERSQCGGLDSGLIHEIVRAAKNAGRMSLLVFWDDGCTTPLRTVVSVGASQFVAQRWLVRAGTRVDVVL